MVIAPHDLRIVFRLIDMCVCKCSANYGANNRHRTTTFVSKAQSHTFLNRKRFNCHIYFACALGIILRFWCRFSFRSIVKERWNISKQVYNHPRFSLMERLLIGNGMVQLKATVLISICFQQTRIEVNFFYSKLFTITDPLNALDLSNITIIFRFIWQAVHITV